MRTNFSTVLFGTLANSILPTEILVFNPYSMKVHEKVLKGNITETKARFIQATQYFAKAIDYSIQMVATLIFPHFIYFSNLKNLYKEKKYSLAIVGTIGAPLAIIINYTRSVFYSFSLYLKFSAHVFMPYQTLYAIYKGKEAAKEYFDFRKYVIQNNLERFNIKNDYLKMFALKPLNLLVQPDVEKPKITFDQLDKEIPFSDEEIKIGINAHVILRHLPKNGPFGNLAREYFLKLNQPNPFNAIFRELALI